MTEEQFNHYIKGGKFEATYNPKITSDLSGSNRAAIGDNIEVYQNIIVVPTPVMAYPGQHAFSSDAIQGRVRND